MPKLEIFFFVYKKINIYIYNYFKGFQISPVSSIQIWCQNLFIVQMNSVEQFYANIYYPLF